MHRTNMYAGNTNRILRLSMLAAFVWFACWVWTQPARAVEAEYQNIHYEGDGFYGDLAEISVSWPGNEWMAEKINDEIYDTIYARELELLDFVEEWAQSDPPADNPYGEVAYVEGLYQSSTLLGIHIYVSYYAGGPHPWGEHLMANVDLDTGEVLYLSDIIPDNKWTELTQMFYRSMNQIPYANDIFFGDDLMNTAYTQVQQLQSEDPYSGWTLTDEGLSFYYEAGNIAPYASGDIIIPISTDQLRTLGVNEKYLTGGREAYAPEPDTPAAHSYMVVISDATWEQASAQARNQGGHLVVITSREEQELIEQLLLPYSYLRAVWIGGTRANSSGPFRWITEESMYFTSWGPREPNNDTGDEVYMDMYPLNGEWVWNDVPNDISMYYAGRMGYIVEFEG